MFSKPQYISIFFVIHQNKSWMRKEIFYLHNISVNTVNFFTVIWNWANCLVCVIQQRVLLTLNILRQKDKKKKQKKQR